MTDGGSGRGSDEAAQTDLHAVGTFEIVNERGLHARAATKLVQLASRHRCEVLVSGADGESVNAKSVMGVLLLCGAKGTHVTVTADGEGASLAVGAIGELIAARFGEDE